MSRRLGSADFYIHIYLYVYPTMHNLGSDIDCQTLPLIGCKRQPYTFDLSAAVLHLHSNPQKVLTIASLPSPQVRSFWVPFGRKPIPKDQRKSKIRPTHLHLHRQRSARQLSGWVLASCWRTCNTTARKYDETPCADYWNFVGITLEF